MPIDAAIFDIGNVLLRFDFSLAFQRLNATCASPLRERPEWETLKFEYESGKIGRTDFLAGAMAMLEYRGSEADFLSIWTEIFYLNEPMWALVKTWHPRIPLFLLSNTNDMHVEYFTKAFPGFSLFRDAVYSHEAKRMKPDPEIFALAIRRFQVDPASTLYIDDLPKNVEAAAAAGLQAKLYRFDAHASFLDEMRALGIA